MEKYAKQIVTFYDRIIYLCKSMADNNPSVKTQKLESNMKKSGTK